MPLPGADVDLDLANGVYFWSGGAIAITSELSCSRASTGFVKNSDGSLTSIAANTLRIGTGTGLLVEGARTNSTFDSANFGSANWTLFNGTITANTTVAPDGTTTGDTLVENTSTAGNPVGFLSTSFNLADNTPVALSVFAKAIGRNFVYLDLSGGNTSDTVTAVFDLVNGVVTETHLGNSVATLISTSIEPYINGWFRCSLVGTKFDGGGTTFSYRIGSCSSGTGNSYNGSGEVTYNPTTGTNAIALWGAQGEVGNTFTSSYIPTAGANVTRAADAVTIIGVTNTDINAATASIVAQTNRSETMGLAVNVVDSNGTNLVGYNAANNAISSITSTLATINTANRTLQDKIGLAWNASGRSLVLDGGTVFTDAVAQTPSATQNLGSTGLANFAFGYIERLSVWTSKLSSTTLQGLTSLVSLMPQVCL